MGRGALALPAQPAPPVQQEPRAQPARGRQGRPEALELRARALVQQVRRDLLEVRVLPEPAPPDRLAQEPLVRPVRLGLRAHRELVRLVPPELELLARRVRLGQQAGPALGLLGPLDQPEPERQAPLEQPARRAELALAPLAPRGPLEQREQPAQLVRQVQPLVR